MRSSTRISVSRFWIKSRNCLAIAYSRQCDDWCLMLGKPFISRFCEARAQKNTAILDELLNLTAKNMKCHFTPNTTFHRKILYSFEFYGCDLVFRNGISLRAISNDYIFLCSELIPGVNWHFSYLFFWHSKIFHFIFNSHVRKRKRW